MVNIQVKKAIAILPKNLFFGFEELDFYLKASKKGYVVVVDCKLFLEARLDTGRLSYVRPSYQKKKNLARYSIRNLLFISDNLTLKSMRRKLLIKWVAKAFYGYRYGIGYGWKNMTLIFLAFRHYFTGVKGKTISI